MSGVTFLILIISSNIFLIFSMLVREKTGTCKRYYLTEDYLIKNDLTFSYRSVFNKIDSYVQIYINYRAVLSIIQIKNNSDRQRNSLLI